MIAIISDKQQPYQKFMLEALKLFEQHNIKGIAIVALCDEDNKEFSLDNYWNMSLRDKEHAESCIRYDAIDQVIMANADRYFPID